MAVACAAGGLSRTLDMPRTVRRNPRIQGRVRRHESQTLNHTRPQPRNLPVGRRRTGAERHPRRRYRHGQERRSLLLKATAGEGLCRDHRQESAVRQERPLSGRLRHGTVPCPMAPTRSRSAGTRIDLKVVDGRPLCASASSWARASLRAGGTCQFTNPTTKKIGAQTDVLRTPGRDWSAAGLH